MRVRFSRRDWNVGGERRLRWAAAVSIAVHGCVLLALTLGATRTRPVIWQGSAQSVSLVSLSGPVGGTRATGAAARPRPAPPVEVHKEAAKKPVKPAATAPKVEAKKPKVGKLVPTKMQPEPRAPRPPAALDRGAHAPVASRPDSAFGRGTGSGSPFQVSAQGDGGPFVYDYYLQALSEKISRVWEPPAGVAGREGETAAMIRFRVMANGHVPLVEVETPSSIDFFDRSAREAVLRAQPFPPLPPAYGGRWLMVHLKFQLGASSS